MESSNDSQVNSHSLGLCHGSFAGAVQNSLAPLVTQPGYSNCCSLLLLGALAFPMGYGLCGDGYFSPLFLGLQGSYKQENNDKRAGLSAGLPKCVLNCSTVK